MEAKDHNYGVAKEQGPVTEERGPVTMGTQEERTMSVLAHLSIFLNLVTGFLGPVAALIIWLVYRDRSSNVGFQALQSMWYQVAWLVILVLIGFLLVPVMALITLVPFVHSAYAAYRVSKDSGYRYPLIADMIEAR
jgi:uncharacterized Tic20 family protein